MDAFKNSGELEVAKKNGATTAEMGAYKNSGKLEVAEENGAATAEMGAYKYFTELKVTEENGSAIPATVGKLEGAAAILNSGMTTTTAQSGMTDTGSRVLLEALNGVVLAHVGSGVSLSARSGMSCTDSLTAPLISGMAYPDLLMAPPVPPASENAAVTYLDWLTANHSVHVPPMAGNGMVYVEKHPAINKAPDAGAVSHIINVTDGAPEFRFRDIQVVADEVNKCSVAGAFTERVGRGLAVLGLAVASVAVTGLTAGEATPATGLGLMAMLVAGLSLVTVRVLRA